MSGCWCGAPAPAPYQAGYGRCSECGTLVSLERLPTSRYLVATDDASAFYGRSYWERRVPEVLGLPRLEERARTDLTERCLVFLPRILRFLEPGRSVLELGCAHGGLTYLMNLAGLVAQGLEMSPWLVEWARDRFDIPVHLGPLESLALEEELDAIVAVDVLEHLPDPLATLRLCRESLRPGGRLFLQTPRYRDEGPEWSMFLPEEHLFLFTGDSVQRLLREAGFATSIVEPSLFPYDMWVVAGAEGELEPRADSLVGLDPELQALLDLRQQVVEGERTAESLRERADSEETQLRRAAGEIAELRADQTAQQALIRRIDGELEEIRADQRGKEERIAEDARELGRLRQDLASQEGALQAQEGELARHEQEVRDLGEARRRLGQELEEVQADQAAKEDLIQALSKRLEAEAEGREAAALSSLRWRARWEEEAAAREARDRELAALSRAYQERLETGPGPGDES